MRDLRSIAFAVLALAAACSSTALKSDGGSTTTSGACLSDKDCRATGRLCDPNTAACVQCLRNADCPTAADGGVGAECVAGACVAFQMCINSLDCKVGEVCDPTRGRCVACVTDTDCMTGSHCVANVCRPSCASDKDCVAMKQLCDFASATCVDCVRDSDCGAGTTCNGGACTDSVCTPGATSCTSNVLFTCSATGTAWQNPVTCPVQCHMTAAGGTCSDAVVDGGPGAGGSGGSDASTSRPDVPITGGPCGVVIDDMEDGDGYICRGNGRLGQWYTAGSTAVLPDQTLHPIPPTITSPARGTSNFAMRMSAPSSAGYNAILGVDLQYDGATVPVPGDYGVYDASQYQGITFWAHAAGLDTVGFDLAVACGITTLSQYGGHCNTLSCIDNYAHVLPTTDWAPYSIPFSALAGGSSPLNKAELTHFQFKISGFPTGAIELWIDDLAFYR